MGAPGPGGGILLTNFPARGWLAYDALRERRADLIMCALTGNPDGSSEVDYTVNPATGFPWATGPRDLAGPLNSVLPGVGRDHGRPRRDRDPRRRAPAARAPARAS